MKFRTKYGLIEVRFKRAGEPKAGGPIVIELPAGVTGEKLEQLKADYPIFKDACEGIFAAQAQPVANG